MYIIYRYCHQCHKIVSLAEENFYTCYNPGTKKHEGYFICPQCGEHSKNRMPEALTRDELEKLFRNFQILKDRSDYNKSTLYNIYWVIYRDSDYITCYGTGNEQDFFYITR